MIIKYMKVILQKIPLRYSDLPLQQPLRWDIYDSEGILLMVKGEIIQNDAKKKTLIMQGCVRYVPKIKNRSSSQINPFTELQHIAHRLERLYHQFPQHYSLYHFPLASEQETLLSQLRHIANNIQSICHNYDNISLSIIHLAHYFEQHYTVYHPLHTAILCQLMAIRLGYSNSQQQALLHANLTCNIASIPHQTQLHQQQSPPDIYQRQKIRHHPEYSYRLLKKMGVTDTLWLNSILQHHEKLDGSGYPKKLVAKDILPEARLMAIADIYCAMVSPREYRAAMPIQTALQEILWYRYKKLDEQYVLTFIEYFGIYPPGSIVRLHNGDVAIVIQSHKDPLTPLVCSIYDEKDIPYQRPLIHQTRLNKYQIKTFIPFDKAFNLSLLWEAIRSV